MTRATTQAALPEPGKREERQDFLSLLERSKGEIAKVLPEGIKIERVVRMATTLYKMTPAIRDCTPISILAFVMRAAELGFEPGGPLKQCWPVPFRDNKTGTKICTFVMGYQGVLDLARRSGMFGAIDARVVLDSDEFTLEYSPEPHLSHKPDLTERGAEIGSYAYCTLLTGETVVEFMGLATLEKIRKCSKDQSYWEKWWGEKAKNAVLKRLLKRQPLSVEVRRALEEDDAVDTELVTRPALAGPPSSRSAMLERRLTGELEGASEGQGPAEDVGGGEDEGEDIETTEAGSRG